MKLQFKTEDLLKKVEGLIIKDVAARKEHNRKVDVINKKVDEYIDKQNKQRQSEIEKAETILAKYSDEELRDLFFEKEVVVHKKGWFTEDSYIGYKEKHPDTIIEEYSFRIDSHTFHINYNSLSKDVPRTLLQVDEYTKGLSTNKVYHTKETYVVFPYLTSVPKVSKPINISESPSDGLCKLKNKCLQAKQYGVEECILEDKDLSLLNIYQSGKDYQLKTQLELLEETGCYYTGNLEWYNWNDIINEDELS